MDKLQAKNLFQLQTELVDTKVDMAVNKAIDRVIEQINNLRVEMHDLKGDMNKRFVSLEHRMIAVETKLGLVNDRQREIRNRFFDYSFKAGWLFLGAAITYAAVQAHIFIK